MSKVKIVLNRAGVRELLLSPEISATVETLGNSVANKAGDGYRSDIYSGKNRVNSRVVAETSQAQRDNLENNTLLKALY